MSAIPEAPHITVEVSGHVATLWLDRPDSLNAMAPAFWDDFPNTIEALGVDDAVRVIVIAGKGRAFTAGIDLKGFAPMLAGATPDVVTRQKLYRNIHRMQHTFTALAKCPKPVIAAIHGYCLGAGVDMITACDIRLASADATFSVREAKLGFVADVGTAQRLPKIVNASASAELMFTGRDVSADEALAMGLVGHVYPDADTLHKEAAAMAEEIAANSPLAVQGAKHIMRVGETLSTDEALEYMAVWNSSFLASNDIREAMTAFLEKREPKFDGT